jgi:thiamine biosynthesis protein ThiS
MIRLNGEPYGLPGPATITTLLEHLGIDPRRVAVERNMEVVRRQAYDTTPVLDGDEIEIVNFVGGGTRSTGSTGSSGSSGSGFSHEH